MKNVKNVHLVRDLSLNKMNYWQIDHEIKNISEVKGITILDSLKAWGKFKWTRKWFNKKPKEGYFVWVKEQINFPLRTCITIASLKTIQNLSNLLVIENGIRAKAIVTCNSQRNNLCGKHIATGKIVLKKNASLNYNHFHKWGEEDIVSPRYEFILEENSKLIYNYQNLFPPKNLDFSTFTYNGKNSSCQINVVINATNSKIKLSENIFLKGENSRGILKLKLAGGKNSQIEAVNKIIAQAPSLGHLDCQGLMTDKSSSISLTPVLICKNNKAQLTHEASIGKIEDDQLNYLKTRGLTEKEATDLIVSGFLQID